VRLLLPLLLAGLVGCAGAPEKSALAPRHEAADAANRRAAMLFSKGETAAALDQAERAYKLAAAVEYDDGIAASRINLSIILARLGKAGDARRVVDALLLPEARISPQRRAEAALRRAVLALDDREYGEAGRLLDLSAADCGECALQAPIANARAQLALAQGQLDQALAEADRALRLSRAAQNAEETANALRVWGNAAIYSDRAREAGTALDEALRIDKHLALPRKLYRDLVLLGLAARTQGDTVAARTYWRRATAVALANDDAAGQRESTDLIRQLPLEKKEAR